MDRRNFSIVNYFSEQDKHRCGYCKQLRSSVTYGMWAQCLTVQDYQDLIDRGWRRSGKYCYKPIMDVTCCPMYTIRCEALNLKLSKSQKKILKRVNKFLNEGIKEQLEGQDKSNQDESHENPPLDVTSTSHTHVEVDEKKINLSDLDQLDKDLETSTKQCEESIQNSKVQNDEQSSSCNQENIEDTEKNTSTEDTDQDDKYKQGEGIDSSKPPCKKAKLMRIERKRQKLAAKGIELNITKKNEKQEGKSLEQFLSEIPQNPKHKLRISLVRTTPKSEEWLRTSKISHDIYVKYQMAVHGDSREKCSENQFTRFLVESPLELVLKRMNREEETFELSAKLFAKYQMAIHRESIEECDVESYTEFLVDTPLQALYTSDGPRDGYGSFHQQYWLDDRLIAVGVIDILPKCISSVYFFYDPDFSNLSLGTYGSLRELDLTRELHKKAPELQYYYMGYYIHSCPKMRYKANLTPSFLLCPETYFWFPIENCLQKLNIDAYARFNDDPDATDINACTRHDIKNIPILYNYTLYRYSHFRSHFKIEFDSEMLEYANLVGKYCASRMVVVKD